MRKQKAYTQQPQAITFFITSLPTITPTKTTQFNKKKIKVTFARLCSKLSSMLENILSSGLKVEIPLSEMKTIDVGKCFHTTKAMEM